MATTTPSGHSPSAPTARDSPRAARIGRHACGTRPPARCWPPAGGTRARSLALAFSPDGSRLVTASADGTVRQWDARTGLEVEPPYDRHSAQVFSAVYSPDGQWVASAGDDRTIRVWRARGRQDVAVLHGHTGRVSDLAFAPDGRRLASLSSRWELVSWRGRHGAGLGCGPPGDLAGAARPHQGHLSGGL